MLKAIYIKVVDFWKCLGLYELQLESNMIVVLCLGWQ